LRAGEVVAGETRHRARGPRPGAGAQWGRLRRGEERGGPGAAAPRPQVVRGERPGEEGRGGSEAGRPAGRGQTVPGPARGAVAGGAQMLRPELRHISPNDYDGWEAFAAAEHPEPWDEFAWFVLDIGLEGQEGTDLFQVLVATPAAVSRAKGN